MSPDAHGSADNARVLEFVRHPPVLVGELATALGVPVGDLAADGRYGTGSARASGVSLDYAWDMYHERPVGSVEDLARRRLTRYSVSFASGRAACEAQLRALHGPAVAAGGRSRYGPFDLTGDGPTGDGRFTLAWSATPPDPAVPAVDAAARIDVVGRIAARVALAASEAELAAELAAGLAAGLAAVPDGAGITASGTGLSFRPPVPAADLARAFGWQGAVGQTVDVHMSAWRVVTVAGDRTVAPRLGRWRVDAYLDGRATGGTVAGVSAPAALVAALGPEDTVRSVGFAAP
jgi:hypothetical protein